MDDKITNMGSIEFKLTDKRESIYNESVNCSFELFGTNDDEILSIEDYYDLCRRFAFTMGFCEATIDEWFDKW